MNTLSLTPLFRQSVGFDRFNDLFERTLTNGQTTAQSYPPYNIEKYAQDKYCITLAVAGFSQDDITITVKEDTLTVHGKIQAEQEDSSAPDGDKVHTTYLYRGIANRAFERTFSLADHVYVKGAELKDGLLRISLAREIPEEAKPRIIEINSNEQVGSPQAQIEQNKDF